MKEIQTLKKDKTDKQPSNLEAEQALLGSVLVNNDIIDEIANIVNSSIFYDPAHTKIYEVIKQYETSKFNDDENSVGLAIDVYQESINKTFREYV